MITWKKNWILKEFLWNKDNDLHHKLKPTGHLKDGMVFR